MKTISVPQFKVMALAMVVALGLFVVSLASVPTAQAHGVVDQTSPGFPASNARGVFNDGLSGPRFQQLTPSVSPLVAVDLAVSLGNPNSCPADFTVKIRSGSTVGPVLGEKTLNSVTPAARDFVNPPLLHFDFTPEIAVVTGNVHYIEASTTNNCGALHIRNIVPNSSFVVFRTSGAVPPVGGIAVDPDLGELALEAPESSSANTGLIAGIVAAVATGIVALAGGTLGAAWYARRRFAV